MSETIYLIEATAYTGSAEETFRFCTGTGYTTAPTDTPANTFYTPRVEHPGLFRQDMFSPGKTSGGSSGGYGEIVLINTDGGLDSFVDYGFDGRRCVVKQGTADMALSEFATVITGTVEQCEVSWNRVTLRLKDRTVELQVPFQSTFYTGANVLPYGIEGTSELKDKPKPLLFGKCNNVTPVMVNTSKLIYQVSASALNEISAVYDNGVSLTMAAGYTDQSDMEANAPAAGEFRPWLAGGCFRLGSSAAGTITADAVQGSTASSRTAGQIIRSVVVEKLGTGQIVEQSIIALDAQAPYVVGFYTGTDLVNTSEMLDSLCASVGAWWGFDNSGLFWSKQLTPPDAAQSLMTLTEAEIISLERTATADSDRGVPAYKINLDFSKNWTVQTSGLAGSIADNQLTFESDEGMQLTEDRRNLLGMEFIRTSATDATVQTKHILAPEITVQTTIDTLADANTEAARQLALRKVRRDRLNLKVPMVNIKYPVPGVWDNESVADMDDTRRSGALFIIGKNLFYCSGYDSTGATTKLISLDLENQNSAWKYDGFFDLPVARSGHKAFYYAGYIWVIGGVIGATDTASTIATNLPYSWGDSLITDLPQPRAFFGSVIYNDYMYVVGGFSLGSTLSSAIRLNMNNPIGAWDDAGVTDLPSGRRSFGMVEYGGFLYVVGGTIGVSATESVIRLDLSNPTGAWDDAGVTDLPAAWTSPECVIVDNFLYVIGGKSSPYTASVIRLDLNNPTGSWDDAGVADLPYALGNHRAVTYQGNIFVLGGTSDAGDIPNSIVLRKNEVSTNLSQLTSLGRTITVKYPRYGYTSGRPMVIIGAESDHSTRMLNLELWG